MLETFEKLPGEKKEKITRAGIRAFSRNSYKDVRTEDITEASGISKGLLFHYFGSKKAFYLYCLERALARLTVKQEQTGGGDFYQTLFDSMDRKMALCIQYAEEMHLVNMASRDASAEILREKTEIIREYMGKVQAESEQMLEKALSCLQLRDDGREKITVKGLHLYTNAVLNQYLVRYQQTPDLFFENKEQIKGEMKTYLDMMLYGICK